MNKSRLINLACFLVVVISLSLGIHNSALYHYTNGFDGSGHKYYVNFLAQNRYLPPPTEWETHQPPLYYILAAGIQNLFRSERAVQFINIIVFWLIVIVSGLGFRKIFKKKEITLLGMFSLISLPMLNIFTPTITNELLSTLWIISAGVSSIFLFHSKTTKQYHFSLLFILLSLILGIYSKISIITILPTVFTAIFLSQKKFSKAFFYCAVVISVFILAYTPIYLRNAGSTSPSNILTTSTNFKNVPSIEFFTRLDWIWKMDMYTAQYYSFSGGGWNSFWTDGQNVITPFVPFHKKSFILWTLGFLLLPLCLYGFKRQFKENRRTAIIVTVFGLSMLAFYLFYNLVNRGHYSAVRLTYEMGIVFPYAYGIAAAANANKNIFKLLFALLLIQYATLISFFWIQPWWFVTKDKFS